MTTLFPKPLDKSVSQTQDGLAIVANGNTHAVISSGQFVYVKNHDTLAEGLYKANSAIDTNGALSTSNLTPDGTGGLNDLQGQVTALNSKIENKAVKHIVRSKTITTGNAVVTKLGGASVSAGLGSADFADLVPSGHILVALIPSQATRSDGVDVAYSIVPDNSRTSIRIYGTPNVTYTVYAEILYM